MCVVCRSPERLEIDGALSSGLSMNECARRFGLTRVSIQRHSRRCLELKYDVTESKMATLKRRRLSGQLETALDFAKRAQAAADAKGDQVSSWRFGKEISKILSLINAAAKKAAPRAVIKNGQAQADLRNARVIFELPPDTDPLIRERYGRPRKRFRDVDDAENTGPIVKLAIQWLRPPVLNPHCYERPVLIDPLSPERGYQEGATLSELEIIAACEAEPAEGDVLAIQSAELLLDKSTLPN